MPRQSAESKSASGFRAGSAPPEPPKHLSKEAAVVWTTVAVSKPADWFDAGAQLMLETLCETVVHGRAVAKKLNAFRKAGAWDECKAYEKRLALMSQTISTLSTKLRLSVQAIVDRHSRKLGERGQGAQAGGVPDTLLGGRAVWGDDVKGAKPN